MLAFNRHYPVRPEIRPVTFGHKLAGSSQNPDRPPVAKSAQTELKGAAKFCDRAIENWYQNNRFVKWLKNKLNIRCLLYDKGISPYHCSQIARMKIQKDGALKGVLWTFGRISWCNPLTAKFKCLQKFFKVP